MGRKQHTAEPIIQKLRDAEIALVQGQPVADVGKELEREDARLRELVADPASDHAILREVALGNS